VRSVPMPTLIGVPAPVAPPATTAPVAPPATTAPVAPPATTAPVARPVTTAAATTAAATTAAAAAAPSAWEIESTEVSAPRRETRVPGAAFTLPANPLSDLDGADLASFIELKLLEIEGVDSAAIVIGQPAGTATPPAPDQATLSPPVSAGGWAGRREQARRIARRYGPYASFLVVGLLAGLWLRSGTKAAPVVAPPAVTSPVEIVQPEPPPAPAPVAAAKVPPAARAECVARVTTKPAGAAVFWGDVALGPSPIEGAPVRCGNAVVTVKHERYADLTRTITAERGRSAVVSERLARPPAKVTVASSPPGARIKLNRRAFGEAPRKISTLRFERVRIDASLPGYQPWSKTFYMREAETTVAVMLTPVPKPNARRAPASHK
jgi:PEGA domain